MSGPPESAASESPAPGLAIRGLHRHYGGVAAVAGVDLDIPAGQVSALIGPNGAGKTTLLHCVTGLDPGAIGSVTLTSDRTPSPVTLSGLAAHERARRGIAWTFQRIEIFDGLTVAENIRVGAENRRGRPLLRGILGLPDPDRASARATAAEVLDRLGLASLAAAPAGSLPTGTMRIVELARAIAARPVALLLDEPAAGLDDQQIRRLAGVVRGLAASGIAVLVVEHDMRFVASVADAAHLMIAGRIVVSGPATDVLDGPAARRAYLGGA
jgi:branched-chain amino acid transport system ATP-binding protein